MITDNYDPQYSIDVTPDYWVLPNRVRFPEWVYSTFKQSEQKPTSKGKFELFSHQAFVKNYLQFDSPYRGLLLYHGLGVGKTCASIAAAEILLKHKDVIVMLQASLKQNFLEEVKICGNNLFVQQQKWKLMLASDKLFESTCKLLHIEQSKAKKDGGVWVPSEEGTWYTNLNDTDKLSLDKHLNFMIEKHYTFINYNGLRKEKIKELTDQFENKVIIIDEVHQFISTARNPRTLASKVYKIILDTQHSKIICLSGTPMKNNPSEIAYLINLIKGYIHVFYFKFEPNKIMDMKPVEAYLKQHMFIDTYAVHYEKKHVMVSLLPPGFIFTDKSLFRVKRLDDKVHTYSAIIKDISEELGSLDLKITKVTKESVTLLPEDEEKFNELFIDVDALKIQSGLPGKSKSTIKNQIMLSRRLQGTVSYYSNYDKTLFPEKMPTKLIKVPMTDDQFQVYYEARMLENDSEINDREKRKKYGKAADNSDDSNIFKTGNIFKTFSRAACHFAFPKGISRPYSRFGLSSEMDVDEDDANIIADETKVDDKYKKAIQLALQQIEVSPQNYLSLENIKRFSPKYYTITKYIDKSPGPCLVYSQFRSVEGLMVFSMVLDKNGYCEFKIKKGKSGEWELRIDPKDYHKKKYIKFSTAKKDETSILMSIFNSDFNKLPTKLVEQVMNMNSSIPRDEKNRHGDIIKVIMVTQSGAEGISLKNVRQVHIMEPFWNDIRIQQVIGRAIRARSHVDLPEEERKVNVYVYVTSFTEKQKEVFFIKSTDMGITSDQFVYNIASKKKKITEDLLAILQGASVDCNFHQPFGSCFNYSTRLNGNEVAYELLHEREQRDERYLHDVSKKGVGQLKATTKISIQRNGISVEYAVLDESDNVVDIDLFNRLQRIVIIGRVQRDEDGTIKKLLLFK